jgi:hypothetical protein
VDVTDKIELIRVKILNSVLNGQITEKNLKWIKVSIHKMVNLFMQKFMIYFKSTEG